MGEGAIFSGHGHRGYGDVTFLVVEEQDFKCSRLNPPLLFIPKAHGK